MIKIFINATLFLAVLVFVIAISCNSSEEVTIPQSPDDHLYLQRAYPYPEINQESVREVRKHVQSVINSNQSNSKNDNVWKPEGPTNIGGRVTDIARHPILSETFYIGCSMGGIFETINGGNTWTPIFDDVPSQSIGNIAISKSNPCLLYTSPSPRD